MDVPSTPTRAPAHSFASQRKKARLSPSPRAIVIVGAGFSGTAVAINLLRLPRTGPLHLVLIDRGQIARGVAYASENNPHPLNVPAGRMSASSADPLEFLSFARRTLPNATEDDFLPRRLYGDYLQSTLESATRASPPHVRLDRIRGTVIAIERPRRTACIRVHLESAAQRRAVARGKGFIASSRPHGSRFFPGRRACRWRLAWSDFSRTTCCTGNLAGPVGSR